MSAGGGQAGGAGQRHSCRGVGLCCWARDSFTGRGLAAQDRSSTRVRPALAPCGRQLPGTRPGRAAPCVKRSLSDSAAPRFTPGSRMTVLKEFILTSMYFYLRGKLWITISPDLNLVSARVRPPHSEDRAWHQRLDVPQLQVPCLLLSGQPALPQLTRRLTASRVRGLGRASLPVIFSIFTWIVKAQTG